MSYSYVIVDDDSKSMLKTQSVMEMFSNFELLGTATSYTAGLDLILDKTPDFVLLEVNPQDRESKLSLQLLSELHRYLKKLPHIIIVSHDQSEAFEAIKHNVLDYLIKPIAPLEIKKTFLRFEKNSESFELGEFKRINSSAKNHEEKATLDLISPTEEAAPEETFSESIQKELVELKQTLKQFIKESDTALKIDLDEVISKVTDALKDQPSVANEMDWSPILNQLQNFSQSTFSPEGTEKNKRNLICIKSYGDYRFLELDDIAFLQADNNSTDITLKNGEQLTAFKTLKYFEENLPGNFYRIHNSYIVNKDYISRIHTGNSICYIKNTKHQIPYSKGFKDNLDLILSDLAGSEFREN
ncbi:LytR/AlgR family response regulator transcription factor [Flavobacterium sp. UBA6135]|uniref:LytR/AlgR family response regulator transcription factor n=1 Tax=Flavobacterium sp. UBA6135 TaxID=1946553 RepID=UPI0025C223A3|nr:response regulator transcription factor [Flavobacterium sp. UBA6135]